MTPPSVRRRLVLAATALCLAATTGHAEDEAAPDDDSPAPAGDTLEGAIGLLTSYGPDYSGAAESHASASPGFFIRYHRLTVTNASGFVTRRSDDVVRGLGLDLVKSDRVRLNFALRIDNGRGESASGALAGMGDIERTLRGRAAGTWQFGDGWRAGASWNVDLLRRGGGHYADLSFARERRVDPHTVWTWGGSLAVADGQYLRTYFGVDAEQAARSGYPLYVPGAGLRDASLYANLQADLGERWVLLAGVNASRLLGPARDSPLSVKPDGWGLNGGLAWRF
jgi:outer membrane scaffolding protein for murein synthesis (MipA/OmpV family)